jgi:hypothetical protein
MSELKGPPADITFTVTVKRAATGIEETYNMVGHIQPTEQLKEIDDGSNPLNCE